MVVRIIISLLIVILLLLPGSSSFSPSSSPSFITTVSAIVEFDCNNPTRSVFEQDRDFGDIVSIVNPTQCNVTFINVRMLRLTIDMGFSQSSSLKIRGLTCTDPTQAQCITFAGTIANAPYIDIEDVHFHHVRDDTNTNDEASALVFSGGVDQVELFRIVNISMSGRCRANQCFVNVVRFAQLLQNTPKLVIRNVFVDQYETVNSTWNGLKTQFRGVYFENTISAVKDILIEDIMLSSLNFISNNNVGTLRAIEFSGQLVNGQPTDDHTGSRIIIRNVTLHKISFSSEHTAGGSPVLHYVGAVSISNFQQYETVSISEIIVDTLKVPVIRQQLHFQLRAVGLVNEAFSSLGAAAESSSFTISDVSISNVDLGNGENGAVTVQGFYNGNSLTGFYQIYFHSFAFSNIFILSNPSSITAIATCSALELNAVYTPKHQGKAQTDPLPSVATNFVVDDLSFEHVTVIAFQNTIKGTNFGAEVKEYEVISLTNFRADGLILGVDQIAAAVSFGDSSISLLEGNRIKGWNQAATSTAYHRLIITNFSQQNVVAKSTVGEVFIRNFYYASDSFDHFINFNTINFENHLLQNISVSTSKVGSGVHVDVAMIEQPVLPNQFSSATNATVIFRNITIDQVDCKIPVGASTASCLSHGIAFKKRIFGLEHITFEDFTMSNFDVVVPSDVATMPFIVNVYVESGGIQASTQTGAGTFNENTTIVFNNIQQKNVKIDSNSGGQIYGFRLLNSALADFATVKLTNFIFEDISINGGDRKRTTKKAATFMPVYIFQITAAQDQEATTGRSLEVNSIIVRRAQLFAVGVSSAMMIAFNSGSPTLRYTRISFKNMTIEDNIRVGFADSDTVGTNFSFVYNLNYAASITMSNLDPATLESLAQKEETIPGFFCDNFLISDVEAHSIGTSVATTVQSVLVDSGLANFPIVEFTNLEMNNIFVTSVVEPNVNIVNTGINGISAPTQTLAGTFNSNTRIIVDHLRQTNIEIESNGGGKVSAFRLDGTQQLSNFATVEMTNFLFEDIRINSGDKKRTATGGAYFVPVLISQINAAQDQEATTGRSITVDNIVARRVQVYALSNMVMCVLFEFGDFINRYTRISFKNMVIEDEIKCGFADSATVGTNAPVSVAHVLIMSPTVTMSNLDVTTLESLSQNEEMRPGFFCDNFLITDVEAHSLSTSKPTGVHSVFLNEGLDGFPAIELTNLRMQNIYVTSRRDHLRVPNFPGYPPYPKGVFISHLTVEKDQQLIQLRSDVPSLNGFIMRNITLDSIHGVQHGEAQAVVVGYIHSKRGVFGLYNVTFDRIHFTNISFVDTDSVRSIFHVMIVWFLDGSLQAPTTSIIAPTTFVAQDLVLRDITGDAAKGSTIMLFYLNGDILNFVNVTLVKWRLDNIHSAGVESTELRGLALRSILVDSTLLQSPQMVADSVRFELKVEDFAMNNVRLVGGSGTCSAALFSMHYQPAAKISGYAYVDLSSFEVDNITLINRGSSGNRLARLNVFFFNNNANPPSVSGHAYSTASLLPASYYRVINVHVKNIWMENSNYPVSLFVYESFGIAGGFTKVEFDDLRLENATIQSMEQAQNGGLQITLVRLVGTSSSISLDDTRFACERKFSITNSAMDNLSIVQDNPSAHPIELTGLQLPGDLTNAATVEINQVSITNIIILNSSTNAGLKVLLFDHLSTNGISAQSIYSKPPVTNPDTQCSVTQFIAENLEISNIAAEEGAAETMTSWKLQMVSLAGELIDYSRIRLEAIRASNIASRFSSFDNSNSDNRNFEMVLFYFGNSIDMKLAGAGDDETKDIYYFTMKSCSITDVEFTGGSVGSLGCFRFGQSSQDQSFNRYTKLLFQDFTLQRISFNVSESAEIIAVQVGGDVEANGLDDNLPQWSPSFFVVSDILMSDVSAVNLNSSSSSSSNTDDAVNIFGFLHTSFTSWFYNFTVQNILLRNCYAASTSTRTVIIAYFLSTAYEDLDAPSSPLRPPSFTIQNIRVSNCTALSFATSPTSSFVGVNLHAVSLANTKVNRFVVHRFKDIVIDAGSRVESLTGLFVASLFINKGITSNLDLQEESSLSFENIHISDIAVQCTEECTEFDVHAMSFINAPMSVFNYFAVQHVSISNCDIFSASTSLINDLPLSVSLFYAADSDITGLSSSASASPPSSSDPNQRQSLLIISDLVLTNLNVQMSTSLLEIEAVTIKTKSINTFAQILLDGVIIQHLIVNATRKTLVLAIVIEKNPSDTRNLLVSNCSISHANVISSSGDISFKVFQGPASCSGEIVFDSIAVEKVFVRTTGNVDETTEQSVTIRSIHFDSDNDGSVVPFSQIAISNCFISTVDAYASGIARAMILIVHHRLVARTDLSLPSSSSLRFSNLNIEHLHLQSEGSSSNTNSLAKTGTVFVSSIFESSYRLSDFSDFSARNLRQSNITIESLTYSNAIAISILRNEKSGFDLKESIELEGFKMENINVFTSSATSNRPSSVNVSFAAIRLIAARTFIMSNMEVDLSQVLPMKEETGKERSVPRFTFLEFFDREEAPTPNSPISMTLENNKIRSTNIPSSTSSSSSSSANFFRLSSSWMPLFSNLSFIHNDMLLPNNEAATNERVLPIIFFEFTPFNQVTPPSSPATIVFDNNSLFTSAEARIISTSPFVDQTPTKLAAVFLNCNNRWIRSFERATKQRVSSMAIEFPNMNCPATASPSVSSSASYSHNTSEITPPRTLSHSLEGTISNNTPSHTSSFPTHTITPPIPPRKKVVDAIPSEAKLIGNIFSAISGPMGAMTTRKIMSIAGMADCGKEEITDEDIPDVDDIDTNPMRLKLGSSRFSSHRGSIFGSVIFCICWLLMMFFFAFLRSKVDTGCSLSRAMRKIGIPGTVAVPAFSLFPVAVNSGAKIAKRYYINEKFDIFVLIFASTMTIIVPIMALVWICYEVRKHEILRLPKKLMSSSLSQQNVVSIFKQAEMTAAEKEAKEIDDFVKDASMEKVPKWKIWLDYLTEPTLEYKRSKFLEKYGPIYDNAVSPIFIILLFIFAIIGEIGEGYASLCDQNDYVCCQSGVMIVAGSAVLDFLLIVVFFFYFRFHSPFLVRLEKWFFPVVSLIGVINTFLIVLSFFTGQRNSDGVNSVDFTDVLTITTEIAFYITIVVTVAGVANEVFSGATYEFYSAWKTKRDVKKYEEQARLHLEEQLGDEEQELDEVLLSTKTKKQQAGKAKATDIKKTENDEVKGSSGDNSGRKKPNKQHERRSSSSRDEKLKVHHSSGDNKSKHNSSKREDRNSKNGTSSVMPSTHRNTQDPSTNKNRSSSSKDQHHHVRREREVNIRRSTIATAKSSDPKSNDNHHHRSRKEDRPKSSDKKKHSSANSSGRNVGESKRRDQDASSGKKRQVFRTSK